MSSTKKVNNLSKVTSLHKIHTSDPVWHVEKYL